MVMMMFFEMERRVHDDVNRKDENEVNKHNNRPIYI